MLASLKQLAIASISHLQTRLALLELELQEEKARLVTIAISMVLAFLFVLLALIVGTIGIVASFWDSEFRMQAIWILAAAFVLGAIACWLVLKAKVRARSSLFKTSLAELGKDKEALERGRALVDLDTPHPAPPHGQHA